MNVVRLYFVFLESKLTKMEGGYTDTLAARIKIEDVKTIADERNTSKIGKIHIVRMTKVPETSSESTQVKEFDFNPNYVTPRKELVPLAAGIKIENVSTVTDEYETNKRIVEATKTVDRSIHRKCHLCGKVFASGDTSINISQHYFSHGLEKFKCSTCGKKFSCPEDLLDHERRGHVLTPIYKDFA